MKEGKLGGKIGFAFGILILITLVLGGIGILNMISIGKEADQLSRQYLPEVKTANELERRALLTMHAIRGFSLTGNLEYLIPGHKELESLRTALGEAQSLAQNFPALATLRQNIDKAQEALKNYQALLKQSEEQSRALYSVRLVMDQAAASYMISCYGLLTDQKQVMQAELSESANAKRLAERLDKIFMLNNVIDMGNLVRIANFKSQVSRRPQLIESSLHYFEQIEQTLDDLKKITRREESLSQIETIKSASKSYKEAVESFMQSLIELQNLDKQREAVGRNLLRMAQITAESGLSQTQSMADRTTYTLNNVTLFTLGGLLAALVVGIFFAVRTTRNVTRPVKAAAKALGLVSQGDFRIEIDGKHLERGDELGGMMRDVQTMAHGLSGTVREVAQATDLVAASANQISVGNQDLSERTQRQASAIEQTASALQEMTSSVQQSAEHSRQANEMARNTAETARQGGKVVEATVDAMAKVTESSHKISDIITVVNEIAFQTNLLALNAAVEAARAGEAGRGFAVVAGEVRSLAGRSASAAKEIKTLISDSVEKVEQGNQLVGESGRLLNEIIYNVQDVAETVSGITAASQEQAVGIEEVNKAVMEMDQAVQNNATLVEEAAAASESMASAAEDLREQMRRFKVDGQQDEGDDFLAATGPDMKTEEEFEPMPEAAPKPRWSALEAKPKQAPSRKAKAKKPESDEFFEVDDLEGFEEF